ncbi:hypothetical protein HK098_008106 [Nowakowskiella sp. JEL0407]|nr:hypothetical protein HK098_008106 [Nowakowskiella sp. JEL0407]
MPIQSEDEIETYLQEFKSSLQSEPNYQQLITERPREILLSYLYAMKFNVLEAKKLYLRSLEFRTSVVQIPIGTRLELEDFEDILSEPFICIPRGLLDVNGQQVVIVRPRFLNPHKFNKTRFIQGFWTMWEHVFSTAYVQTHGISLFADAAGVGPRNFDYGFQYPIIESLSRRLPSSVWDHESGAEQETERAGGDLPEQEGGRRGRALQDLWRVFCAQGGRRESEARAGGPARESGAAAGDCGRDRAHPQMARGIWRGLGVSVGWVVARVAA